MQKSVREIESYVVGIFTIASQYPRPDIDSESPFGMQACIEICSQVSPHDHFSFLVSVCCCRTLEDLSSNKDMTIYVTRTMLAATTAVIAAKVAFPEYYSIRLSIKGGKGRQTDRSIHI